MGADGTEVARPQDNARERTGASTGGRGFNLSCFTQEEIDDGVTEKQSVPLNKNRLNDICNWRDALEKLPTSLIFLL